MSDLDIYTSIAANLEESGWSSVLSQLDQETFAKLTNALDSVKEVAEAKDENVPDDPAAAVQYLSERFDKVVKGMKAHRMRLQAIDTRLAALEAGGGGGGGSATTSRATASATQSKPKRGRRKRKLKNQADMATDVDEKEPAPAVDASRKHTYKFGNRNVTVIKPLDGYPNRSDARTDPVRGDLNLEYVHGYNGQSASARQNICLTPDGRYVIYFIAAVGIVYDVETQTQKFFSRHNDDLTAICLDPREGSTLVATGQKDPKDTPGEGKDLPKVWIWDYSVDNPSRRPVKLLENIGYGKVVRVQWSTSGYFYAIEGGENHDMKVFDSSKFVPRVPCTEETSVPTGKIDPDAFLVNPHRKDGVVDSFVFCGSKQFAWATIKKEGNNWTFKKRAVPISGLKKDGENKFLCAQFLPNGNYAVGGSSGAMYICRDSQALAVIATAHDKAIGAMAMDRNGLLISAGNDQMLKKWSISDAPLNPPSQGGRKKRGGPRGPPPLNEEWSSGVIEIVDSDFHSLPRSMAYDEKEDIVYLGSRTNQMMRYEFNSETPSLIIDGHDGQIWGLCTSPVDPLFLTGGYDNAVKLWDAIARRCIATLEFELEEGDKKGNQIVQACWSNDGRWIAVGSEQSNIFILTIDASNQLQVVGFHNIPPKNANAAIERVSYMRFSPDSKHLGVAHMDSQAYIFTIQEAESGVILEPWQRPIAYVAAPSHLQWSNLVNGKGYYIKVLTRDYEVVHHKLMPNKRTWKFSPHIPLPEDVQWADDPLVAGWDVEGLYQSGWDGTDLNDASVTGDGGLIASGDDYGVVRLHNYPAIAKEACKAYTGHAEFVVGVEFLRDDSQLITCGGEDKSIMQWSLTKAE